MTDTPSNSSPLWRYWLSLCFLVFVFDLLILSELVCVISEWGPQKFVNACFVWKTTATYTISSDFLSNQVILFHDPVEQRVQDVGGTWTIWVSHWNPSTDPRTPTRSSHGVGAVPGPELSALPLRLHLRHQEQRPVRVQEAESAGRCVHGSHAEREKGKRPTASRSWSWTKAPRLKTTSVKCRVRVNSSSADVILLEHQGPRKIYCYAITRVWAWHLVIYCLGLLSNSVQLCSLSNSHEVVMAVIVRIEQKSNLYQSRK